MAFPPGGHGATCVVRTMVRGRHVIHLDHVVGMYDMSTKYHDSASSSSEATARVGPSEISSEAGPRAPKGPAMAFPPARRPCAYVCHGLRPCSFVRPKRFGCGRRDRQRRYRPDCTGPLQRVRRPFPRARSRARGVPSLSALGWVFMESS